MEENSKKIYIKKVLINIGVLIAIGIYFIILNLLNIKIDKEAFINIYKYMSMGILLFAIILFEIAYKKDSGTITIFGIEVLILSVITLLSINMASKFKIDFQKYLIASCVVYVVYYIFKFIIIHTINRRTYLKSLSDIKEIVTSEPLKKEARKRNN